MAYSVDVARLQTGLLENIVWLVACQILITCGTARADDYCPGYRDELGHWNNGFRCPTPAGSQGPYCCGTERHKHCCPQSKPTRNNIHKYIPVIIGVLSSLVVVLALLLLGCFFCPGCPAYKRRKQPRGQCTCDGHFPVNMLANGREIVVCSCRSCDRQPLLDMSTTAPPGMVHPVDTRWQNGTCYNGALSNGGGMLGNPPPYTAEDSAVEDTDSPEETPQADTQPQEPIRPVFPCSFRQVSRLKRWHRDGSAYSVNSACSSKASTKASSTYDVTWVLSPDHETDNTRNENAHKVPDYGLLQGNEIALKTTVL